MSDRFTSHVRENNGSMHTGSGDVINNIFAQLAEDAGKEPQGIANDQLAWLRRHFVPPAGFDRALGVLRAHRTVFLAGAPGTGRKTAAWMLLNEFYTRSETLHEVMPREDRADRLDPGQVDEGSLLLLDLSANTGERGSFTDERGWSDLQGELSGFRRVVHERMAYLAVVLPDERAEQFHTGLAPYCARIVRPAGLEVLRSYLRAENVAVPEDGSVPQDLTTFLGKRPPMRRIAHLASLVVEARDATGSEGGFTAWCGDALTALGDKQSATVGNRLATLCWGPQRALLLATAMLHGAHAEVVHRASASLLKVVGHPQAGLPLLEQADFSVRLREIGANTDSSGRVRFDEFGYDSAVRIHFWTHWPQLREPMRAWVADTVGLPGLEQDDRDKLVQRFTERCLHERYRDVLPDFVQKCAEDVRNGARMGAASQALRRALAHEEHGRFFRQKIYEWAKTSLPQGLVQVLVVACWKAMAVHHPEQAMVRLHHLARREGGTTHARHALTRIVDSDPQLRVRMLKRLVERLGAEDSTWRRFDAGLFLDLADPMALTAPGPHPHPPMSDPAVRGHLTSGWRFVLHLRPPLDWIARMERWLRTAYEDEGHREHLVDVLVEGSRPRTDLLASLHVLSRKPGPAPEDEERRRALVDLVWRKITAVLNPRVA
ncbi:hypothetical protein [Streptosporangium sp. NPDC023615]|uniref:nSTAND3 domain-containing NTPase n=1 Tax=Streptosporangium sp. NPDC023615 TaxID=3154794 RepID=UPI0034409788